MVIILCTAEVALGDGIGFHLSASIEVTELSNIDADLLTHVVKHTVCDGCYQHINRNRAIESVFLHHTGLHCANILQQVDNKFSLLTCFSYLTDSADSFTESGEIRVMAFIDKRTVIIQHFKGSIGAESHVYKGIKKDTESSSGCILKEFFKTVVEDIESGFVSRFKLTTCHSCFSFKVARKWAVSFEGLLPFPLLISYLYQI